MTSAQTIAGIAVVVALLACLLAIGAQVRISRLRRELRGLGRMPEPSRPADPDGSSAGLRADVDRLAAEVPRLRADLATSLRNVAVVRYDAFGDMGGRLSFSAALVDDSGDGVVLSSIHARAESRTYAKGIVGGQSDVTLTPEEQEALAAARSGRTVR